MKITNAKVIEVLDMIGGKDGVKGLGDKALPMKLSYAIVKNKERLMSEIYKPYEKSMTAIREKYYQRDKDGNPKKAKNGGILLENVSEFTKELRELLEIENDFMPHTVSEDVLDECEKERYDALTPKECEVIMEYFMESAEQKKADEPA